MTDVKTVGFAAIRNEVDVDRRMEQSLATARAGARLAVVKEQAEQALDKLKGQPLGVVLEALGKMHPALLEYALEQPYGGRLGRRRRSGLSSAEGRVLSSLRAGGRQTRGDVARMLDLEPRQASHALRALVKRGLACVVGAKRTAKYYVREAQ